RGRRGTVARRAASWVHRVRLLAVRKRPEDLERDAEVGLRRQVREGDALVGAAQLELPPARGERADGAVEVVDADGDVVHTLAVLGQEARVGAAIVERLDQLPEEAADAREREPPGGVNRLPALLQPV